MSKHRADIEISEHDELMEILGQIRTEFKDAVSDVEWRLAQHYELQRRQETGEMSKVYAEDVSLSKHLLTGYTLTSGTPTNGISWAGLHIVYQGVDYTIPDGNTLNKYAWFIRPSSRNATITTTSGSATITGAAATFDTVLDVGASISGTGIPAGATITAVASGTSATISANATASGSPSATISRVVVPLTTGDTVPALTVHDQLVFNNIPAGVGSVADSGVAFATGAGTITDASISSSTSISASKLGPGYAAGGLTGTVPTNSVPVLPATKLNIASHVLY